MSAKRTVPNSSAPRAFGLLGLSSLGFTLLCACSGSIEETDVDDRRVDYVESRGAVPASPTGSTGTPSTTTPVANPPASTPPANPPASTPPANPPASTPPADDDDELPASSATVSFETDVWPIFSAQCGPCHTVANFGNQNIGADDKDAAFDDAVAFKAAIVSDIQNGSMPQGSCSGAPGTSGCVTVAEFNLIKSWADGGALP